MLPARSALARFGRLNIPQLHRLTTAGPLEQVRVRFAPSPTGTLHVGGARTALFNWLAARQSKGGAFIVRVEDTDEARSSRASEESILSDLRWLGLQWDEGPDVGGPAGPYRQSERKQIYLKYAEQLVAAGKAYYCFSSDEEIAQMKDDAIREGRVNRYNGKWRDASPADVERKLIQGEPYTVRFRVPPNCHVSIDDQVRGIVTWEADASIGDFIILRSNGMPVYNFCVAVDDFSMGITHVIRAEEHLPNTLRQVLLFNALGKQHPVYAHCSLILASDRSKLSKRHGATSVTQFREAGYLPSGMINYLSNLGWNDGTTQEIYNLDELVKAFSINKIVKSAAVFDVDKLNWVNSHHIKRMPPKELCGLLEQSLRTSGMLLPAGEADKAAFMSLVTTIGQPLLAVTNDIRNLVSDILDYPLLLTLQLADVPLTAEDQERLSTLSLSERKHNMLADASVVQEILQDDFTSLIEIVLRDIDNSAIPNDPEASQDGWKLYIKKLSAESKRKGKRLFHPLRLLLTGRLSGPDVGMQLQLLRAASFSVVDIHASPVVNLEQRSLILRSILLNLKNNKQ